MRFADFLRTAVLIFMGAASALAVVALLGAERRGDLVLVGVALAWWGVAGAIGAWLGRGDRPVGAIGRLLAQARTTTTMPEPEPGSVVFNRLWAVGAVTFVAGAVAFLLPQVPAVAAGYALLAALAWRKQARAVVAIEERDGVRFHLERSSPFRPPKLLRTPGLRKLVDERDPVPAARG